MWIVLIVRCLRRNTFFFDVVGFVSDEFRRLVVFLIRLGVLFYGNALFGL